MKRQPEEPEEQLEAYPITYGVLGLLGFLGPMSGYDIKRAFDGILEPMWGVVHSQIYKELRRMEALGWVKMKREEQENRPDRKVYSITPEGYRALAGWQGKPAFTQQVRDELLLKITFGSFAPPGALSVTVKAGIAFHQRRLDEYRDNLHHILPRPDLQHQQPGTNGQTEDPFARQITILAITFEEVYVKWLNEVLALLEKDAQSSNGS